MKAEELLKTKKPFDVVNSGSESFNVYSENTVLASMKEYADFSAAASKEETDKSAEAVEYINRAIIMLNDCYKDVAGYNGIVSLLTEAKMALTGEPHPALFPQKSAKEEIEGEQNKGDWRLPKYKKAIDDIYNSGVEGRNLVIKYFGLHHPFMSENPSKEIEEGKGADAFSYYYPLFKYFADNHDLTLLESEIQDIVRVVKKFLKQAQKDIDAADKTEPHY